MNLTTSLRSPNGCLWDGLEAQERLSRFSQTACTPRGLTTSRTGAAREHRRLGPPEYAARDAVPFGDRRSRFLGHPVTWSLHRIASDCCASRGSRPGARRHPRGDSMLLRRPPSACLTLSLTRGAQFARSLSQGRADSASAAPGIASPRFLRIGQLVPRA